MTVLDRISKICDHVGSKLTEKILLNISPDWLNSYSSSLRRDLKPSHHEPAPGLAVGQRATLCPEGSGSLCVRQE